ncbi:hypothetical protein WKW79_10725 [Variovorax robiniae]|uniref:DUF2846 domain-containing protein n=1 Tax=Variovorax robiniae TaxID=1836199 RepID=A0ABU8X5V1_9BURK
MRRRAMWLLVSAWTLFLVGCGATGPRYSEVEGSLPSLGDNQGRIVFLRDSGFGGAVQPEVRLDGQVVGKSQPNSFFFVDRPAGTWRASASTETETSISVPVKAKASSYVLMGVDMGLLVGRPSFQVLGESEGKTRVRSLAYGGAVPVAPGSAAAVAVAPARPAPSAPASAVSPSPPKATPPGLQVVEYTLRDSYSLRERRVVYRVDESTPERRSFNNGGWVEKPDGEVISVDAPIAGEFDLAMPPGGWIRGDLADGSGWSADYRVERSGLLIKMDLQASVVERSRMTVAGRELQVVQVDYRGFTQRIPSGGNIGAAQPGRFRASVWWSPELARVVRFEARSQGGSGGNAFRVDERLELAALR